jgi:hypothetical protein
VTSCTTQEDQRMLRSPDGNELTRIENPVIGVVYVESPYTFSRFVTVCLLGKTLLFVNQIIFLVLFSAVLLKNFFL